MEHLIQVSFTITLTFSPYSPLFLTYYPSPSKSEYRVLLCCMLYTTCIIIIFFLLLFNHKKQTTTTIEKKNWEKWKKFKWLFHAIIDRESWVEMLCTKTPFSHISHHVYIYKGRHFSTQPWHLFFFLCHYSSQNENEQGKQKQ